MTANGSRRARTRLPAFLAMAISATVLGGCAFDIWPKDGREAVSGEPTASILGLPRFGFGRNEPSFAGLPAEEAQCRRRLKRLGVQFTDIPAIRDSAACGIDHPVEVTKLTSRVEVFPPAKLTCAMAEAMAEWTRDELQPAARFRYLSPVVKIRQMSSYSCRTIRGGNIVSEHAKGNALDIGALQLASGRVIVVKKPGFFSLREKGFLNSIRANACDHFSTILGPGSDADHKDHFHFDIKERRKGRKHCD